jgi:nucleotide-binding universal stress UspA family protein
MMKNIKKILVAIDRSAMAEEALKRAISIAKEKEAQLIVMHVVEPSFIESPFVRPIDENKIKKEVKMRVEKLTSEEDIEYVLFVESGSAAASISLKVKNLDVDLLVIGTHGKDDISSNYFGSTTLKLIQKTHIPVLVVKNEAKYAYKEMLAPTNLSDYSKESILFARTLFDTTALKYLHAYVTVDELQALTYRISADQQGQFKKELLTDAHIALEKFAKDVGEGEMVLVGYNASINEDLLDYIVRDNAGLLVLGSKGVGNLNSFLFGSTASYLVRNSPTDVLVYVPVST